MRTKKFLQIFTHILTTRVRKFPQLSSPLVNIREVEHDMRFEHLFEPPGYYQFVTIVTILLNTDFTLSVNPLVRLRQSP